MESVIFTALVFLCLCLEGFAQDVNTTHGKVTGLRISVLERGVDAYYGIPFAKPPIGDLRFKHPQAADHWRPEVKEAHALKPSCPQVDIGSFGNPLRELPPLLSEDCLYLNVWVPTNITTGTKLATMVWIYGGAFVFGTSSFAAYDGKYLAAENNVIVASMNYRIGVLGFMYLGPDTSPGNQGMMDQRLALEWIYDNVEQFGGDRNLITIFGESAGGASVGHHLLSPLSRDFFTRAILESGSPNAKWAVQTPSQARASAMTFATSSNCVSNSDVGMFNCMRTLTWESILKAQSNISATITGFAPVIDGHFLPDDPLTMLEKGDFKKTDVLLGVNKDEGTVFLPTILPDVFAFVDPLNVSRSQFLYFADHYSQLIDGTSSLTTALVAQYEGTEVPSLLDYVDLADDMFGDYFFKCPMLKLSNPLSAWSNIYAYHFELMVSYLTLPKWVGAAHSYEIEIVFGQPLGDVLNTTSEEKELSRAMMTYWTNFAKTGNPNLPTGPSMEWPRYDTTDERVLVLDIPGQQRVQQGLRKQECVFWDDLVPLILENTGQPGTTTERVIYLPCPSSASRVKVISWMFLMTMVPCFILVW